MVTPYDPNTVETNANPGQSTSFTNSESWQEQARRAGWQAPEENSGFQQSSPQTQPMQTTPVDVGAGSSPMNVPLTPETKSGAEPANLAWDKAQLNKDTGLPDEVTLTDVFSRIKLTAVEASSFLAQLAGQHHGGPNQDLANKLNKEAAKVANPDTYKQDADTNR